MAVGDRMSEKNKEIIKTMKADGKSGNEIAGVTGISRITVNKFSRQKGVKRDIERLAMRMAKQGSKLISSNTLGVMKASNTRIKGDPTLGTMNTKDLLELSDKKEKRLGETIGLFPTTTKNPTTISTIINANTYNTISPVVMEALMLGLNKVVGIDGEDAIEGNFLPLP